MDTTKAKQAVTLAEHLVGNLYFNLDFVPVLAGHLRPETMRLAVGNEPGIIYSEMCRLMRANQLSTGSLEAGLRSQSFDMQWLSKLQSRIDLESLHTLHRYADEVQNAADLLRLQIACNDTNRAAQEPDARADVLSADLLSQLSDSGEMIQDVQHISQGTALVRDRLTKIRSGLADWGRKTGFKVLDKIFQMVNGELIVIAARPSQGKTALWRQIMYRQALDIQRNGDNEQIVFFSADDTMLKVTMDLACSLAMVDSRALRNNELTNDEWQRLDDQLDHIDTLPIFIDETAAPTVDHMYYRLAMLNAQKPVRLAAMDYMQQIKVEGAHSERQAAQDAALGVKGIGNTLKPGFPFVLLSQIGKSVESKPDKWPTPSDLLYSGEAEANVAMMMMRPEHYISRGETVLCNPDDEQGVVLLNVGKNKSGDIGRVRLGFKKEYMRYADLERHEL